MTDSTARGPGGIDLKVFEQVDAAREVQAYVAILDAFDALPGIQALKQSAVERSGIQPGMTILDAGCGPGLETVRLARFVGPTGKVVGVDASHAMLDAARHRAAGSGLPVEYEQGDAGALPFPDRQFDLARAERLFPYLPDPAKGLAELIRVTRRGGLVCAIEPDFETSTIDLDDRGLVRRVLHHDCDHNTRNGWIGRQLPRLFKQAGLVNVRVEASVVIYEPRAFSPYFRQMARSAHQAGIIAADELAWWQATLEARLASDELFCTVTYFLVMGAVPPQGVVPATHADA